MYSDVIEALDDDTVLMVMGDHGMTLSGDHGGDSHDEVMAGLFVYSNKNIFKAPEVKHFLDEEIFEHKI